MAIKLEIPREIDGKLPAYAWPGGYPVLYILEDGGVLCPACANGENGSEAQVQDTPYWNIVGYDCNWEDPSVHCDHCGARIESAYAEDETEAAG